MSKVNLAIIGGGLVGASLALALQAGARERGWSIVLIEPFAPGNAYQPSYDARSSALSYGSRQIYERLGLWPAIAERAEPILHIHVSDRGRFGATRLTAIEEGVPALGLSLIHIYPSVPGDAAEGLLEQFAAHRIVDHIDALAAGQGLELLAQATFAVVDQFVGAGGLGHGELVGGTGGSDHPGAHGLADLHGS